MANKKDEDRSLWDTVKRSIKPLEKRDRVYSPFTTHPELPETETAVQAPAQRKRVALPKGYHPTTPPKTGKSQKTQALSHGESPGVDKRTANRLRKGRMQIDGKLDLHGMTQAEAHRVLIGFIENAYAMQKRCVIIVTGKGRGILKDNVPRWLNEGALRSRILSFSYAQQRDGGEGALYVLIKRQRDK
ncbi:Smr/MutS family protein [Aestuariispira ectoiniformans]|uniref:Smr/MutS family protein n=1 Tax=Aestuariispira ectoiniformans TaxID=2775080 RepID=UPI00223BB61E|nr:Smr/MutS family protein [Aestuariispira ectoiniformans]